jgi:hypothetical protein
VHGGRHSVVVDVLHGGGYGTLVDVSHGRRDGAGLQVAEVGGSWSPGDRAEPDPTGAAGNTSPLPVPPGADSRHFFRDRVLL